MSKHSMSKLLPHTVKRNLELMGEQIKLARKRRKLSLAAIAERAQCSQLTLMRVEKGAPTVSIGTYARVLFALGLADDLLQIAGNDKTGETLVNIQVMKRYQNKKEEEQYAFD